MEPAITSAPTPPAARTRRLPGTALGACVAVAVAAWVVRCVVTAVGWFYWDDLSLYATTKTESNPFALLLRVHDGHVMPGAWIIEWLLAHAAPLNWAAAVAVVALLHAVALAAVGRALWILAALRGASVSAAAVAVPLALYGFAPLVLPAGTWVAASLNALPLHAALALGVAHIVRAVYGNAAHPGRDAAVAAVAVVAGGCFTERALFIVPAGVLVLLAMMFAGRGADKPGAWVRALVPPIIATGIGVIVYFVATSGQDLTPPNEPSLPGVGEALKSTYVDVVLPALAGGPWQWDRWHPGPPFADPSALAIAAGVAVAAAVLAFTYLRKGAGAWLWMPVAAYPIAPALALAFARSGPETAAVVANTMRHVSELSVLIALCATLIATFPGKRSATGADVARAPAWRVGAAVAAVLLIASSAVTHVSYARSWSEQPSRDYFAGLRDTAAERGEGNPLPDQAVALDVLLPVVAPNHMLSRLVDGVPGYPEIRNWATDPVLLGDDGRPRETEMLELRHIAQGPEEGCGTRIPAGSGPAQIPLDGPLIEREWVVQLNYFTSAEGTVDLSLGSGEAETVPVTAGLGQVTVLITGDGESLGVAPSAEVGDMCVASGPIGGLLPK
ncbi:hypothetical protein [Dietzia timorensis]|uniref:Glycosyltransferase RgtA/B/C/D-like domain-containing protein n=1 Tax=Dietzia timorensis TaxID=499555 RepID=A0A173LLA5_9ACTN|nr:hypothetical protein [Dietzia timorensis]ANI91390.1 Hypothetical protein BJL86_0588 [Dietzia timorensis]